MRKFFVIPVVFALGWVLAWQYFQSSSQTETAQLSNTPEIVNQQPIVKNQPEASRPLPMPKAVVPSEAQITKEQLVNNQFEVAMSRYSEMQSTLAEDELVEQRKLILSRARALINTGQMVPARRLLSLYLANEIYSVDGLELLTLIDIDEKKYLPAIETLYKARAHAHTQDKITHLTYSIRSAVSQYKTELFNRKDHLAMLELYQRLVELEPEHTQHYIGLAEAYLALGNMSDARSALDLTLHDPTLSGQANEMILMIDQRNSVDETGDIEIPLTLKGNQFLLEAVFDNEQAAILLLDTGASLSIISPQLLNSLSYDYRHTGRTGWFNTANGRVQAPIVRIDSISLGGQSVNSIEVGVLDLSSQHFDGLLGMNFLQHFEFFIDQQNKSLRLR